MFPIVFLVRRTPEPPSVSSHKQNTNTSTMYVKGILKQNNMGLEKLIHLKNIWLVRTLNIVKKSDFKVIEIRIKRTK